MTCGKVAYDTERAARVAVTRMRRRRHKKAGLRAYKCCDCTAWHLSTKGRT